MAPSTRRSPAWYSYIIIDEFDERIDDRGGDAHRVLDRKDHGERNLVRRVPRDVAVQQVGEGRELLPRQRERRADTLGLDRPAREQHHEGEGRGVNIHGLELRHRGADGFRLCRDGRVVGEHTRHTRCLGENLIEFVQFLRQPEAHLADLLPRHLVAVKQLVDVEPVARFGRDAPGGGVRLFEVTERFKFRHLVADGRRGAGELILRREVLGADRLAIGDVRLHNGFQNLLFSVRQIMTFHGVPPF